MTTTAAAPSKSKKVKRKVTEGIAHIKATFNNTIVTITTAAGDVLCQNSAGASGFKGSRKGTPFAAQLASEAVAKIAKETHQMKRISVKVKGPGAGRDSAIRALESAGLEVIRLEDVTAIPHNGCRPAKKRRV